MLRRAGARQDALRLDQPRLQRGQLRGSPPLRGTPRHQCLAARGLGVHQERPRPRHPAHLRPGWERLRPGEGYVYVYAARYAPTQANRLSLQRTQGRGGEIALLRASRGSDLMRRDSWQFFAGRDRNGQALWSSDARQLKPVITDQNGVGWTVSATYDPGL